MAQVIPIPSQQQASDETLMQAFKQTGDQGLLATLYLRYSDLLYGVCLKYLENTEEAKDAVMNIYEELLRKLAQHEVQNFKSWVYVLAKNHCLMRLRSAKKKITVSLDSTAVQSDEFSHLDNVLEQEETFKRLERCMGSLPSEQEKVIRMFYYDQKCYNEIVGITGVEWNKVRSLIQNGRRNLKICMEKHGG